MWRVSVQGVSLTEMPLDKDPFWTETASGQRPPGQRPLDKDPLDRDPWTETPGPRPLDRNPLHRDPWRDTPMEGHPWKEHRTRHRDRPEGIWDQGTETPFPGRTWDQVVRQEVTSYRDPPPCGQND